MNLMFWLIAFMAFASVGGTEQATTVTVEGAAGEVKAGAPTEKVARAGKKARRPARITAEMTTYDRKEGIAVFDRNVRVDDEEYQLCADRVYVFLEGTNDLKRIVAVGNVAMTNGLRSARAAKASYHRQAGMVVLYADEKNAELKAEVTDADKGEKKTVRGEKIKFWINSEQVEVTGAVIDAPTGGMKAGDLKEALGK